MTQRDKAKRLPYGSLFKIIYREEGRVPKEQIVPAGEFHKQRGAATATQ